MAKLSKDREALKEHLKNFLEMPSASRTWVMTMGLALSESKFGGKYRASDIETMLTELAPPTELQTPWSVKGMVDEFLAERASHGSCYVSQELRGYKPDPLLFDGPELHRRRVELENDLLSSHSNFMMLTDIHTPFQCAPAIEKAIALGKKNNVSCVVLGGDAMDLYCFSRFVQEKQVAFEREVEDLCRVINQLLVHFDEVVIFPGNHERRMKKTLSSMPLPGSFRKYMDLDPIEIVINHLPEKNQKKVRYTRSFWIKVGNLIMAHPDTFASPAMKTAQRLQEFFLGRRDLFDIDDFRHIATGHTHHAGAISWGGSMLYETGCLTWNHDYHEESGRLAIQPWALGAGIFCFEGRKLSLADSGVFQFEVY